MDTWIKTYIDIRSKLENNLFSLNFLSSQKKKIVIGKNFQKIRVTKEGRKEAYRLIRSNWGGFSRSSGEEDSVLTAMSSLL